MSQNISFANWLSAMLDKKSISKAALARGVGVSRATVTEWCNGNVAAPSDFNRKKVENFFKDCGSPLEKSVVVIKQDEIKVFPNMNGGITIMQTSDDSDQVVISFHPAYADTVCAAIEYVRNFIAEN